MDPESVERYVYLGYFYNYKFTQKLPKAEFLWPPIQAQHTSLSHGSAKTRGRSQELNTFSGSLQMVLGMFTEDGPT